MKRRPEVHVPARGGAAQQGVHLGRVGLIAVVGFVVGIVWPRLAGVSLVPSAPVEGARQEALAAQDEATAQAEGRSEGGGAEAESQGPTVAERLDVDDFKVTSCRDAQGQVVKDCGELDARALLEAPLRGLATCPAAENAVGTLSVGMEVDFKARRAGELKSGRSTDLPAAVTKGLLSCVARELDNLRWSAAQPSQASYTIYALVQFKRPEQVAAQTIVPASGSATVRWKVALVRADGDSNAKVRARLASGTRVIVTARQGEWYRVKYDAKGGEGWVHGEALGLETKDLAQAGPGTADGGAAED